MKPEINQLRSNRVLPSRRTRRLVLIITFGLLAVLGGLVMELPNDSRAAAVPASAITVAAIEPAVETGYQLERRFVGRVEAMRTSAVGFEFGGLLAKLVIDEGERVSAGDVLAQLDTERLEAKRVELVAAHNAARAKLELATQTLKRLETVIERGLASNQQLDEAREQFRSATAEVELARARTDAIDVDIARSTLLAPFDAVITRRYTDEGKVVTGGEPVLQLQEYSDAEIRVGVAGPLVSILAEGQTYTATVNGVQVETTVKTVLPVRGLATRTVDVILSLDSVPDDIRDGDLVTLLLADQVHEPGYWLPLDALTEGIRGLWTAYTLRAVQADSGATHEVVPALVDILHTEADRVYIRAGLPDKSMVIRTGVQKVVPGQLVRVSTAIPRLASRGDYDATE